ncbi:MAG TPA: tRNA pseudouridine(38-40) synthase TruA [Thermoanaerobaculia bacterium]|nr:tRNA pseudouridine(38-40) synthase TruA [Thermoanaerobaculia bacterium]
MEYEGTRYHGWQEQQNARSVAGELRRAIQESGAEVKELGGSGRTDAGVHALAQTAHLRLARAIAPEALRREVNERLPADIHLIEVAAAAADFHARHDAVARSYLYQVSRRRTALAKRYVWWVKRPLDAERMAAAAAQLRGCHDFRLFCERPAEQPSTLVEVEAVELKAAGSLILCRFVASHFLWKMVRRLAGALVRVGAGELDLGGFAALLEARQRAAAAALAAPGAREKPAGGLPAEWTAPPSGLFLERVLYPGDPPLLPLAPVIPVP